ncbi:MAG: type II toxin-antitoxin system Phd/YefM family antitoxin [Myxococcota bacterium]
MAVTTFTSREFNQDVSRAKRVAKGGPVFITDRGRPAHVLLTIEDYRAMTGEQRSLADAMAAPDLSDIDFDLPTISIKSQPADFE